MNMSTAMNDVVDYHALVVTLTEEFAATAAERDAHGGTPKRERDLIRSSGLLKLLIPREFGGAGQPLTSALQIVRAFAVVDSSLAHVFAYHHLGVITPHFYGTSRQKETYYTETARHNWFWCNAANPLDRRVTLTRDGTTWRLNGTKSFCSGSQDADLFPVTAVREAEAGMAVIIVPTTRTGVRVNDDWDNMGQRQTDSGSVSFDNVLVADDEILGPPGLSDAPFGTVRSCLLQLTLTTIYLGLAQGAFAAATQYTRSSTRPWPVSGVTSPTQDPYILHHYGEMWTGLQAAEALVDRATALVQDAWDCGEDAHCRAAWRLRAGRRHG